MAKIGRPSKLTPAVVVEITKRLSEGEPLAVICRDEHMPTDRTVRTWVETDALVSSAIAHAREAGFDALAHECLEIAEDGSRDYIEKTNADGSTYEAFNGEHVQRSKLRIETRLKLLAKWDPKRYGDKVAVVGGGPDDSPIKTESTLNVGGLSDDQLRVLASIPVQTG